MKDITKTLDSLVINKLTRKQYNNLKNEGKVKDDELYLITDGPLDAVGCTVSNVKTPAEDTDAANKAYVDDNTVSAFSLYGNTYERSKMSLNKVYDVVFDIVKFLGGTVSK